MEKAKQAKRKKREQGGHVTVGIWEVEAGGLEIDGHPELDS